MTNKTSDDHDFADRTTDDHDFADRTSEDEDFADYTDDHQQKSPPNEADVRNGNTPDVADHPDTEPPD